MDRENFKEKAKKSIDDIFAKIDEYEAKSNQVKGDAKEKYNQRLADLKSRRTELQTRYERLQGASQDKWEEAKVAFNEASESFKDGFSRLAALVK